ncbi:hypothetical protein J2Y69_003405 [Microbacterium resistens]|uniref:MatE family transporter n=1 Tax=Microbacterium resistens TaxID=156977 RepID=A0ABU1SGP7_9MICO|nr:hypothetical protein [Microbacterium resistens]MDR6868781.1 hypothetical protein [Microbacterium resistens]
MNARTERADEDIGMPGPEPNGSVSPTLLREEGSSGPADEAAMSEDDLAQLTGRADEGGATSDGPAGRTR